MAYLKHAVYAQTADVQAGGVANVLVRGTISLSSKEGEPILAAGNKKFPVVSIVASKIPSSKQDEAISQIVKITGISEDTVSKIIQSKSDYARILPNHLSVEQIDKIQALSVAGIGVSHQADRFYPNEGVAADVIGFLGYGESGRVGQYGAESFYDEILSGQKSKLTDKFGDLPELFRWIRGKDEDKNDIHRPNDVVLTIDRTVQSFVEDQLSAILKKWSSPSGSIIVQEPSTGKIIALADYPTFNPNSYRTSEPISFLNGTLQQIFEPGSSFKPFTMASGLDSNTITPQTTYNDSGAVEISGYTIKNFDGKAHGQQTMTQVLEKSLNTGTMFVENKVGDEIFRDYVVNFGFGQRTGLDLPGEVGGNITNLYSGRKVNHLTASFGQGIAVTPIQLINAYSAIANGGKLMRPYVTAKVLTEGGGEKVTQPEIIGIPITEKTATRLQTMLTSVVDHGFDKARIPGYDVAGKTGTAQIPNDKGEYDADNVIHSFAGFAPSYNAKFVVLIKMDRPQGIAFAADSLSPVFKEIAAYLLRYYNVPPTRQ